MNSQPTGDLTAEQWVRAAAFAWGRGGLRAVAVESLAKELGVTKGSFYWHFKNRAALIQAVMTLWEEEGTKRPIEQLERIPCAKERLFALFSLAWDQLEHLRIEAAIGASALTNDPNVTPVYERIQKKRLSYVSGLYREMGYPGTEARRRAITAYSAYLGSLQIVALGDPALRTDKQLKNQVKVFLDMLVQ